MVILGITGGSGCGKTTVSEAFRRLGAEVVDADRTARQIVEPGRPALARIAAQFGEEYLRPDGTLDRRKLGNYVFSSPPALRLLNEITHRYIKEEIDKLIAKSNAAVFCIDAAALLDSSIPYDRLLVVLADRDIRARRICARDGISMTEALCRLDAQKPDSFYLEKADFVVYNNSGADKMDKEAEKIMNELRNWH